MKKAVVIATAFALVASMIPQFSTKAAGVEWGPFNITKGYVKTVQMTPETAAKFYDKDGNPISETNVVVATKDFTVDMDFDRMGWSKSDFDFSMRATMDGNWDWDGNYPPAVLESTIIDYEGELEQGGGGFGDLYGIENGNYSIGERLDANDSPDADWFYQYDESSPTTYAEGTIFCIRVENKVKGQLFDLFFLFDYQYADHVLSFTEDVSVIAPSRAPFEVALEGTVYRLYNPADGDHIYTVNADEAKGLYDAGWDLETSPGMTSGKDGVPIYRLTNDASREHMFTADKREKNKLSKNGWTVDNGGEPVFYGAESGRAMYRLFNPNATSAVQSHHFTLDKNEIKTLTKNHGWLKDNDGQPVFYLN